MALHLSGILKDQKWSLGAHFFEETRFLKKERREGGEKLGFARRSGFCWVCFPFLPPKRSSNLQEEI